MLRLQVFILWTFQQQKIDHVESEESIYVRALSHFFLFNPNQNYFSNCVTWLAADDMLINSLLFFIKVNHKIIYKLTH